ncbi:MAG: Rieske 2Fe-2S domain-containing protein, partial [Acidimicrobiales bacterium]
MMRIAIATWDDVEDRTPVGALVAGVDLVIVRYDDEHSVLHGRCQHRGALLADGSVVDGNIVCGVHGWDYCFRTGISEYNNTERIHRFSSWLEDGEVFVDSDEIELWAKENPQPFDRDAYQGAYQDPHGTADESHVAEIRSLAAHGLERTGHHGPMTSMGIPGTELPRWDDIQFVTAQLARRPLADDAPIDTTTMIGPDAAKPLTLDIPIFVSDMSFGALSEEAKTALARG